MNFGGEEDWRVKKRSYWYCDGVGSVADLPGIRIGWSKTGVFGVVTIDGFARRTSAQMKSYLRRSSLRTWYTQERCHGLKGFGIAHFKGSVSRIKRQCSDQGSVTINLIDAC